MSGSFRGLINSLSNYTDWIMTARAKRPGGAPPRRADVLAAARPVRVPKAAEPIADVYEVRLMLEPAAARLAAARAPRQTARALAGIIAEEERTVAQSTSLAALAMRFQEALVDASGNAALVLLVRLLHDLVARQA